MKDINELYLNIERREDGWWASIKGNMEIGPFENEQDMILNIVMRVTKGEFGGNPRSVTAIRIKGWDKMREVLVNPSYRKYERRREYQVKMEEKRKKFEKVFQDKWC